MYLKWAASFHSIVIDISFLFYRRFGFGFIRKHYRIGLKIGTTDNMILYIGVLLQARESEFKNFHKIEEN